jgi:hypothetical protein
LGYCSGYATPGYMNPGPGMGLGLGRGGGGRGWRNMYYATGLPGWARAGWLPAWGAPAAPYGVPAAAADEAALLKAQAEYFERALGEIKGRLTDLEREAKKDK